MQDNSSLLLARKDQRLAIANLAQRHLDARGIARKDLIRDYLSKSTVDKFFQGEFSERTLTKIEAILQTRFTAQDEDHAQAPQSLGGYTLKSVEHLLGTYIFVRPMFNGSANLSAYLIQIDWSKSEGCLVFEERSRPDAKYTQKGVVYVPFGLPFLNLVSGNRGDLRTIQVSLPEADGVCRGIISTLSNPRGAIYIPVAAPVVLRKLAESEEPEVGIITPENRCYENYLNELMAVVTNDYGMFVSAPKTPADRRRTISVVKP